MTENELAALGATLQMCVMVGEMSEADALEELDRQARYAKAVDEVSK